MLRQIREEYRRELAGIYAEREADSLFYWAAQEILGWDRARIAACMPEEILSSQQGRFLSVLSRLTKAEPIQYIFEKAYFFDLELKVTPDVLIPRGETEELVLWAIDSLSGVENPWVLDLCTGSGAIAIALSKARPDARVWACDFSGPALAVARQNNAQCGTSVHFFRQDILKEPLPEEVGNKAFNLIVSNPPYVRPSEKARMCANVLQYEPHSALFVEGNDPLVFYRSIARCASESLCGNASVMVEINEAFPEECKILFEEYGFGDIEVRKDIHSRARMLKGCKIASKNVSSQDYSNRQ